MHHHESAAHALAVTLGIPSAVLTGINGQWSGWTLAAAAVLSLPSVLRLGNELVARLTEFTRTAADGVVKVAAAIRGTPTSSAPALACAVPPNTLEPTAGAPRPAGAV